MDADILLISPSSFYPLGDWVNFTTRDGGCYNVSTSQNYKRKIYHLKKEIGDHLKAGKNVFVLLSKKKDFPLATGVSVAKSVNSFSTETFSNYNFLPISIGTITSAPGKHVEFSGNPVFSDFYEKFKGSLEYQVYIQDSSKAKVVFTGKDRTKILGAVYKVDKGHLILLPYLNYNEEKFTETKKTKKGVEKEYWNKEATKFGNNLVKSLVDIDKALRKGGEATPPPDWTCGVDYQLASEQVIGKEIDEKIKKIDQLILQKNEMIKKLEEEIKLKDLLFEKGKVLENAINSALRILGYTAENYNDGDLELDHVIVSPEKDRFIGEAEGKDTSAINIDKFRQLATNIHEDLQRESVEEPAVGVLFGNGFRLTKPSERAEQFTTKCINTAKTSNCILIRTIDLFRVAKYVLESKDQAFAKSCRSIMKNSIGKIVDFPAIPSTGLSSPTVLPSHS